MADPTIPRNARRRFDEQRRAAAKRGIAWEFTLEQWWHWWCVDDRWSRRGRQSGQLVMARTGDAGPYAWDNVRPFTPAQNVRDWTTRPDARAAAMQKRSMTYAASGRLISEHLRIRGDGHPVSRAVMTPAGRFGSQILAAEFYGVGVAAIRHRVRKGWPGWSYADVPKDIKLWFATVAEEARNQSRATVTVITPAGRFDSVALAAESHGVDASTISRRIRKGWPGWRLDKTSQSDTLEPGISVFYQLLLFSLAWVRTRPWHRPDADCSFAEINAALELCA